MRKRLLVFVFLVFSFEIFSQNSDALDQFEWSYSFGISSINFSTLPTEERMFKNTISKMAFVDVLYCRKVSDKFFLNTGLRLGLFSHSFKPYYNQQFVGDQYYFYWGRETITPMLNWLLGAKRLLANENFVLGFGMSLRMVFERNFYMSQYQFYGGAIDGEYITQSIYLEPVEQALMPTFYFSAEYQPELKSENRFLLKTAIEFEPIPTRKGFYEASYTNETGTFQNSLFTFSVGFGYILKKREPKQK